MLATDAKEEVMDVLSSKKVKTRKEHRCWGCMRKFPAGVEMQATTCADQGTVSTAYWCDDCSEFLDTLPMWEKEDWFGYGDLLNYEEYRDKIKAAACI
jgi:hypothetical protein